MENKALNYYRNGFNCAQSVLKACNEEFYLTENVNELLKASMGLGTGMFMGETCGAVTGSIMALSMKIGTEKNGDKESVRNLYKQIKIFETNFKENNCSLNCKTLKTECKVNCEKVIMDSAVQIKKQLKEISNFDKTKI